MKAWLIALGGAASLLAACNGVPEDQFIRDAVGNTLSAHGNVQQVAMTKGADNNYSGTATVRSPDGRSLSFNCTANRNAQSQEFEVRCLQGIDRAMLDELQGNMRRSLEGQGYNVSQIEFTRRDENSVTGFAQVSDQSGASARLVCAGSRPPGGGRIEARCDVPPEPQSAAPAPEEGAPAEEGARVEEAPAEGR